MQLPYQQTGDKNLTLLQNRWVPILNPLLAAPLANANLLPGIVLTTGLNVINHKLQQKLQGYIIVLNSAGITYYDDQATNQTPDLTLKLVASGPATVSIVVF